MQVKHAPETRNETMLIEWKDCLFSENIFAWFDYGMIPVFSDKLEDLMLPEDRIIQKHSEGGYELFTYSEKAGDYLYTGRLYVPESYAKVHFNNL
jgi:hypothetical protein